MVKNHFELYCCRDLQYCDITKINWDSLLLQIGGKIFFFLREEKGSEKKRFYLFTCIKRTVRYFFKQLKKRDYVSTVVSMSLSTVSDSQQVLKSHLLNEQINEQMLLVYNAFHVSQESSEQGMEDELVDSKWKITK